MLDKFPDQRYNRLDNQLIIQFIVRRNPHKRDSAILVHDDCGNRGKIPNNKSQTQHIFRNVPGHIPDTPNNRSLLENTTTSKIIWV